MKKLSQRLQSNGYYDMTAEDKEKIMNNPRIWVDFNNANQYGNIRLNCAGTQEDLVKQSVELTNGLYVTLYDEEMEVEGVIVFSEIEKDWVAKINWLELVMENSEVLELEEVKENKNPDKKKSLFEKIKGVLSGNNQN